MAEIKKTKIETEKSNNNGKISLSTSNISQEKKSVKIEKKNTISKISLDEGKTTVEKKSSAPVNINKVIQSTKTSSIQYSVSESHLTLIFNEAILLSINQIFAFLQREKQQQFFFMYKKAWHNKINEALRLIKSQNNTLPYFENNIEITLLRQAPREIDKDALPTMFKFIIDGLKRSSDNPLGVLADDNPKVVHTIQFHNEKGEHLVGIKLKFVVNTNKSITAEELLSN